MNKFKEAIEALPAKIAVIRKVEVGLNMNPGETWNIALYSEFDTLEDVKYYATHPDRMPELYRRLAAEGEPVERCVCDFISGMTDRYAIETYEELFVPRVWRGLHE